MTGDQGADAAPPGLVDRSAAIVVGVASAVRYGPDEMATLMRYFVWLVGTAETATFANDDVFASSHQAVQTLDTVLTAAERVRRRR